jgi:hypothetical protein
MLYRSSWGVAISTGVAAAPGLVTGLAAGQAIMLNAGWSEAVSKNSGLTSKATLRSQYDCHVLYAFTKLSSWNLEKFRANNSNWSQNVWSHQCDW